MNFDQFVNGPLLWMAFVFMTIGLSTRLCFSLAALYRRDRMKASNQTSVSGNIGRMLIPYHKGAIRRPAYSALLYTFHLCLFSVPLWLEGHVSLVEESVLQWSWLTLPSTVADKMTLAVIILTAFFLLRRIVSAEVRRTSYGYQAIITLLVFTQFVSGYFLGHGIPQGLSLTYRFFEICHLLNGVLIITGIVFLFYRASMNPDKCVGCGSCEIECPTATLIYEDIDEHRHFEYQPYQCVGCATCVKVCQADAMRLVHSLNFKTFFQRERGEIHKVPLSVCQYCDVRFMPAPQQEKLIGIVDGEGEYLSLCPRCKIVHTAASPFLSGAC